MASWLVRKRYGFGAATIPLAASPYFALDSELALDRPAIRDFTRTMLPMLAAAGLLCVAVTAVMTLDRRAPAALEMMLIPRVVPVAPELNPEPEPLVVAQELAPVAPPVPKQEIVPPPPLPREVAVAKPPPPIPEPMKPPEPVVALPVPALPVAKTRPMPAIAEFAAKPLPRHPSEPESTTRAARARPRVEVARASLAPLTAPPAAPAQAEPAETRRFASVRTPESDVRTRPVTLPMAALAAPSAAPPAPPAPPSRGERAAPAAPARSQPPVANVALAAVVASTPAAESTPAPRSTRVAARSPSSERRGPAPAAPALSVPNRQSEAIPAPERAGTREGLSTPTGRVARSTDPMLAGVPLASLAACVSDREEDALKQRLVAAVTTAVGTQRECKSSAGTYRFVETKNLNAFLLMIERNPHRAEVDRCGELTNALQCVAGPSR